MTAGSFSPLDVFSESWTLGELVAFHTAHKLVLMAHSPEAYRELGRLVAGAHDMPRADLERAYTAKFLAAVTVPVTPGRHVNVLQHIAGYFKDRLDAGPKGELDSAIEDYRRGVAPLAVPIDLLRRHARTHGMTYLEGQHYLSSPPA